MKMIVLAAALALVGCKKSDKSAEAGASCSDTLTKAYDRLPKGNPQMAAVGTKLKEVMIRRCTEDKWPKAALDCYDNAKTQPEMKACRDTLPAELRQKASDEVRQAMMSGMGGMGGGNPHAGMGGSGGPTVKVPDGVNVPVSDTAAPGSAAPGSAAPGSAAPK
jgi:hypothetical protein